MSDDQADGWKQPGREYSGPPQERSVREIVEQMERLDFLYDAMKKVADQITANLQDPWNFERYQRDRRRDRK